MTGHEVSIIVFGGTGDLMKRKLVPSFAQLVKGEFLSSKSNIVGVGRRDFNDESYRTFLKKDMLKPELVDSLPLKYCKTDVEDKKSFINLKECLQKIEPSQGRDRIFYLATSYTFFPQIVSELKKIGLNSTKGHQTRIIFEKPFGNSLASSNKIDEEIHAIFKEEDIFRIDHYLAKDAVQNFSFLKNSSPIFENLLNGKFVESIEILAHENIGVGERHEYYDKVGALKDMVQNHLLQILAIILMDRPKILDSKKIHDSKISVLQNIIPLSAKEQLIGQYESYSREAAGKNIKKTTTPTFVHAVFQCNLPRWKGTKIILETGKKLPEKLTRIIIKFKEKLSDKSLTGFDGNSLIFDIYPDQNVALIDNRKDILPIPVEFSTHRSFGKSDLDEYALLIEAALRGDKTLFPRSDEIAESWKIIEQIEALKNVPFLKYKDYSSPGKRN